MELRGRISSTADQQCKSLRHWCVYASRRPSKKFKAVATGSCRRALAWLSAIRVATLYTMMAESESLCYNTRSVPQ